MRLKEDFSVKIILKRIVTKSDRTISRKISYYGERVIIWGIKGE